MFLEYFLDIKFKRVKGQSTLILNEDPDKSIDDIYLGSWDHKSDFIL